MNNSTGDRFASIENKQTDDEPTQSLSIDLEKKENQNG